MKRRRKFRVFLAFLMVLSMLGSGATPAMVSAEEIIHDHEHEETLEAVETLAETEILTEPAAPAETEPPEVHVHEWGTEYTQDDNSHWRICTGCGEGEEPGAHNWGDGVCTVCARQCQHNWANLNGVCAVCSVPCTHDWSNANGVCAVCGVACGHDWGNANGVCAVCGVTCGHDWGNANGVCAVCSVPCTHDWSNANGVCAVCGVVCTHDWNGNVCTVCGSETNSEDQGGDDTAEEPPVITEAANAENEVNAANAVIMPADEEDDIALTSEDDHEHVWADDWYTNYEWHWHECQFCDARAEQARHTWSDGLEYNVLHHWYICTVCGEQNVGLHSWVDGCCEFCGYECAHKGQTTGTCIECGEYLGEHTHTFGWNWHSDDDKHWHQCLYCGERLSYGEHNWQNEDGACADCGYQCKHNYQHTGICEICGGNLNEIAHDFLWKYDEDIHWEECSCGTIRNSASHNWTNSEGICKDCGYHCSHAGQESGICSICGKEWQGHEHSAVNNGIGSWSSDSTGHWLACSCGEPIGFEEHDWNEAVSGCWICGYTCAHEEIEEEWISDESCHWKACACGYLKTAYQPHDWSNGDDICAECGWQKADNCNHGGLTAGICPVCGKNLGENYEHRVYEVYRYEDNTGHWQICEDCGEKVNFAVHDWDDEGYCSTCECWCDHNGQMDGKCTVCGIFLGCAEHEYKETWDCDLRYHYHMCIFGDSMSDRELHDWNEEGVCSTCDYVCTHNDQEVGNCTICGKYLGVHTHSYNWEMRRDSRSHWYECLYCDAQWGYENHDWSAKDGHCTGCDLLCDHDGCISGICEICGKDLDAEEDHNYTWRFNLDEHWLKCEDCRSELGHSSHDWSNHDGICAECGYHCGHNILKGICETCGKEVDGHEHWYTYADDVMEARYYDETEHWFPCNDCREKMEAESHDWSNKDGKCAICDYTCEDHQYSVEWSSDEFNHWHECFCGMRGDSSDHNWNHQDGKCAVCGYECIHHGITEGFCMECGVFLGGEHDHIYSDAWSSDATEHWHECFCGDRADAEKHVWENGACVNCGYACEHGEWNAEEGTCSTCGHVCEHGEWNAEEGICSTCGHACGHGEWNAEEGTCGICGHACGHGECNAEEGTCGICGHACGHREWNAEEGTCSTCGHACEHGEWNAEEGTCGICGHACEHGEWNAEEGTCKICGYSCEHENQENCICEICGVYLEEGFHNTEDKWENDRAEHWKHCQACGKDVGRESHSWNLADGVCADCGYQCTHNGQTAGVCEICSKDLNADHDFSWVYDISEHWLYCPDCGIKSYDMGRWHDWSEKDGICTVCGFHCGHDGQIEGECTTCDKVITGHDHSFCNDYWQRDDDFHWRECYFCDVREEESPHTWADDWVYDETDHWRECTVCNERNYNEEEVHDWVDGVCDTCGYTCGHSGYTVGTCSRCGKYLGEHTHSFNWRWSVDEKVHWHQCFYCKETLSYGEHDWSDEDGVCAVCGYQCSHGYQYSGICDICGTDCAELHEYFWWTNRTEHCWNCVDCGDSGYWEDHSWNENGVCSVCDYQCGHNGMTSGICEICETIVTGHTHSGGGNGSYWCGGNTHWYHCEDCGESFAEEPHSWKDGYCSICNYQCEHNYEYSGTCEKCGMNLDEIEHDLVLRYNDDNHWYWCTDCRLQITEYENHQYDTETGACTVCGYQCGHGGQEEGECLTCGKTLDGHDHSVKNTEDADWVYDGSGHWLQCSCGEKLFFEKHVRQENNRGCLICDYICDDTLNEEWSFDASGHWKECLCGFKSIFRAHDWSEGNGICAECGYQYEECDHFGLKAGTCAGCGEYLGDAYEHVAPDSPSWGDYSYDEEKHWTYCVNCGEKMDAAPHEWEAGNDSSYHWRICSVCDAEDYYGEHTWENGVCMECGYACTHEGEDGNCTCRICGKLINENDHMFIHKSNRVEHWEECLDCGYRTNIELHTWGTGDKEGICTACNRYCRHDGATSGTCELCGKFLGCEIHDFSPEYESSYFGHWHVCKNCDAVDGEPVLHDWSNKDGICAVCGYVCNSEHELGVCQECGLYLGEHIHEFYTWYEYDESRHWKQCRLCKEVWDVNLHDWSAGDGMCTICHYMCEHGEQYSGICEICHEDLGEDHEHDYKWGFDDYEGESGKPNSHWQFCAICRQTKNTGTHDWSNKDGVCTVCGFPCNHDGEESGICWICGAEIAGHGHSFDRMIGGFDYSTDEYNHWYQCVECGEHFYEEPHVWDPEHGYCALCFQHCQHNIDSEGICTICGMNMNDEKHSYIQRYDRYEHWLECETCENKWKYEAHDWNEGVCEVCGFQCGHNGRQNGECWDCGKILTGQHDHEVTFDGFEAYE